LITVTLEAHQDLLALAVEVLDRQVQIINYEYIK